jgi:hypothetical protein
MGAHAACRPNATLKPLAGLTVIGEDGVLKNGFHWIDRRQRRNGSQLVAVLASEPDLLSKVEDLFWREGPPYEAGAVFDYFFSVGVSAAFGADRPIFVIRIRDLDEIRTALSALDGKLGECVSHL